MTTSCQSNLKELMVLLEKINEEQYTRHLKLLSGATLGQHIRHILEFYLSVMKGIDCGTVNYDSRERDPDLEKNTRYGIQVIGKIIHWLNGINENRLISLRGNFSADDWIELDIESSLNRELAYCYEHSIHHQALIKIGLNELGLQFLIDDNFGVAPATIRYKSTCAQ
ncbi:MAG: hypothetical protein KFF73_09225 [Cyclobacteriaceae bacterium]|nr:hypothetical protein [Cyclobacteriaceae bacterium]